MGSIVILGTEDGELYVREHGSLLYYWWQRKFWIYHIIYVYRNNGQNS